MLKFSETPPTGIVLTVNPGLEEKNREEKKVGSPQEKKKFSHGTRNKVERRKEGGKKPLPRCVFFWVSCGAVEAKAVRCWPPSLSYCVKLVENELVSRRDGSRFSSRFPSVAEIRFPNS